MSIQTLERTILAHLRVQLKRPKLRLKDFLEWSTSEAAIRTNAQPGDEIVFVAAGYNVWCAVAPEPKKV